IEREQSNSPNGDSPLNSTTNVGAKQVAVDAHYRVRQRWNRQTPEGSPHHWSWWDVAARQLGMGCAERVANQNSGSRAKPSTEEEIKSRTIGRGGSNSTIPARRDLAFLEVPFEHDVAMAGSECERWKRTVGRENALAGWSG